MGTSKYIRQLGGETVVYGISGAVSRFIGFFLVPLYTRVFSPEDYGIVAIVTSFVGLLSTVTVLGLDNSSARWYYDTDDPAQQRQVISSWFWCQSTVSATAAVLMWVFAPQIAQLALGSAQRYALVRLVAATVPLGTFGKVLGNWLRYQRRAWMTALFFTASSVGTVGLTVLFVLLLRQGLLGLYRAGLLAALLAGLAGAYLLRAWIAPRRVSRALLRDMLIFGLPLVPASIASWVTASSDRFILKMFFPTAEVGVYAVAATMASAVVLLTGAFQMAWGPFAFSIMHEQNSGWVYSKVLGLYALAGSFVCTALSLFAPLLLRVFTTPAYYASVTSIPYLAFSNLAIGATYVLATGSSIARKSRPIAASILVGAGINTAANFALIPFMGKDGAAISTLVGYAASVVYLYFASQKEYHIPYQPWQALAPFGFSWVLIAIDRLFVPTWGLAGFALRILLCLSFVPLAFGLRIVRPEHLRRLYVQTKQLRKSAA